MILDRSCRQAWVRDARPDRRDSPAPRACCRVHEGYRTSPPRPSCSRLSRMRRLHRPRRRPSDLHLVKAREGYDVQRPRGDLRRGDSVMSTRPRSSAANAVLLDVRTGAGITIILAAVLGFTSAWFSGADDLRGDDRPPARIVTLKAIGASNLNLNGSSSNIADHGVSGTRSGSPSSRRGEVIAKARCRSWFPGRLPSRFLG